MRFADRLFRQGHLSEDALTRGVFGGPRPAHLDECETCRERMTALERWLTQVRNEAVQEADAALPAERLAVQQAQILRRIAQAEEPPRVLEFPGNRSSAPVASARRVAPGWLAVAASAGLAVGVVGGHMTAHLERPSQADQSVPADLLVVDPLPAIGEPMDGLLAYDLDPLAPATLQAMDEYTPSLIPTQYTLVR